jgi:hypothetical protein
MKHWLAVLMMMVSFGNAQTLTLTAPVPGKTLHQEDTVYIDFAGDSTYMTDRVKVVIEISINESYYVQLHPANIVDLGNNSIFTSDSYWGHVPVVVPDSVKFNRTLPVIWRSTISDSIKFRVRDYSIDTINSQTGFLKVVTPTSAKRIALPANSENFKQFRVRINNGVLESNEPMVLLKMFSLTGACIENIRLEGKKSISIPEKYRNSFVLIAQCIFADKKNAILFINTH